MKDNKIIYHGDKEIIEFPEIRTEKYNKDFLLRLLLHVFQRTGGTLEGEIL